MDKTLNEILACPLDKAFPLQLTIFAEKENNIVDGTLVCPQCQRLFPIIDEIPILLPDELRGSQEEFDFMAKYAMQLPKHVSISGRLLT